MQLQANSSDEGSQGQPCSIWNNCAARLGFPCAAQPSLAHAWLHREHSAHWEGYCFQIWREAKSNWLTVSPRGSGTGILPSVQELEEGLGHGRWDVCSSPPASLSCKGQSQVARETATLATGGHTSQRWISAAPGWRGGQDSDYKMDWPLGETEKQMGNRPSASPTTPLPPQAWRHPHRGHYWGAQGPACPDPARAQRSA